MRHHKAIPSLLASLLSVSIAIAPAAAAQTPVPGTLDREPAKALSDSDEVATARIPYTHTETTSVTTTDQRAIDQARDHRDDDGNTFAQMRRGPRHPSPRRARYPRTTYPGMWAEPGNGRHAAIGAVIGFGLGAALGAKANTDQHPGAGVQASLLVGVLGAAIGAAVGYGVPPMRRWAGNRHRPRSPEEDTLASASSEVTAREPSDSAQQASARQPVGTEVNAQVSQATP
jgi:hypothetical protein